MAKHTPDVPPLLLDNRTGPLRFIGEFWDCGKLGCYRKKVYLETGLAHYRYLNESLPSGERNGKQPKKQNP